MKYRSVALFGLIIASVNFTFSVDRTTVVAARMGYPQQILKLRNKTHNFLRDLRIRMMVDVQGYRAEDLDYRADEFSDQYKEAFFINEEDIDEAFEELNQEFIKGADELDEDEATVKQKQEFIRKMEAKAKKKIAALLQKNEGVMRNNPLNIDI